MSDEEPGFPLPVLVYKDRIGWLVYCQVCDISPGQASWDESMASAWSHVKAAHPSTDSLRWLSPRPGDLATEGANQ
jgi:hypothetical protein